MFGAPRDVMLPLSLDSLRGDGQANEWQGFVAPDVGAWFRNNVHPGATANTLFIYLNTLDYRLKRISELTGLDLGNFDDRLLPYVALRLNEEDLFT
ncbi:hypothetical protein EH207_13205 [Brenneria rubrifaciens]|uniref:PucR C-terminal helix-turn-helix domain-containing protein n=1 Tax=Brenneria rubrifaciens TaxID=55213 RepID=A0A4P8QTB3_9GAMM|nr:hypothetical protein EH207_13205 [Brenneria rubrifaciens]